MSDDFYEDDEPADEVVAAFEWGAKERTGRAAEDDGCPPGNHRRDALCVRTRLNTLTGKERT